MCLAQEIQYAFFPRVKLDFPRRYNRPFHQKLQRVQNTYHVFITTKIKYSEIEQYCLSFFVRKKCMLCYTPLVCSCPHAMRASEQLHHQLHGLYAIEKMLSQFSRDLQNKRMFQFHRGSVLVHRVLFMHRLHWLVTENIARRYHWNMRVFWLQALFRSPRPPRSEF